MLQSLETLRGTFLRKFFEKDSENYFIQLNRVALFFGLFSTISLLGIASFPYHSIPFGNYIIFSISPFQPTILFS
jgi:hypothetical protein